MYTYKGVNECLLTDLIFSVRVPRFYVLQYKVRCRIQRLPFVPYYMRINKSWFLVTHTQNKKLKKEEKKALHDNIH